MRWLFVLVFLVCAHKDAAALQRANAQDYRDIADQISKKNSAENDIVRENKALDDARGKESEELKIRTKIASLREDRKNAAEQAMWLTMRAFGIITFAENEPVLPTGKSVLRSPEIGRDITWVPIFEDIGRKRIQNAIGGKLGEVEMLPTDWGNMASDGVARIFPGAFGSPTELASVLIHEKHHFWQNITADEGGAKTPAELEVEAYKLEQGLMNDPDNVLGYTQEIRERQKSRLTGMLIEKKALAKKQRAQVDRARGLPIDAVSIVSLPEDEIQRLIRQAKDQIEIAQRDHDERLRNTVAALAMRSCADPGSVTQAELDGLSQPHKTDFKLISAYPRGLDGCGAWVYLYIEKGANAEQIRIKSLPQVPPIAAQPTPRPVPAPVVARTPFWPVLPRLQRYAVAACRSSGPVPIDTSLTQPRPPFKFSRDIDDRTAAELSAGLGNCEAQLFRRLIEVIRSGQGDRITAQWVQETAAGYRTTPGASPGGGAPPRDREPPPDRKHPDIVIPKPPWENRLKGRAK